MIRNPRRYLLAFLLSIAVAAGLPAFTVKLASPLPEGTEWHTALLRMADSWREITDGRVQVRIYPGGIAGDEADMVRKMRFGQIDAGVFTAYGLKSMVPETMVLILPGLIQNDDELNHVFKEFAPRFDDRFRQEGFEILAWSTSGWAYVFSRNPSTTPDDLRAQALAMGSTEAEMLTAFKSLKFNTVPVSLNEIMVSLQSGLVDACLVPPVGAAAYQWFALAPYMTDVTLAPVVGGMVITQRVWSRIPEEYHEELKATMAEVAESFLHESMRLNSDAMNIMEDNGLVVIRPNPSERQEWLDLMAEGHGTVTGDGKAVPLSVYDDLIRTLEDIRL